MRSTWSLQLQKISDEIKNREAVKSLMYSKCAHYLAQHNIAHTTNYEDLIDLIVKCGAQLLSDFVNESVDKAVYQSSSAVISLQL